MKLLLATVLAFSFAVQAEFIVTSHKTAGLEEPENSVPGMELSFKLPVHSIEIDLHLTKDKVLILSHDPVFDNENCFDKEPERKVVIAQTLSKDILALDCYNKKLKKRYRVPTFDEVLDLFLKSGRTDIELNVEIKVLDKLIENAPRYGTLDTSKFHYPHKEVADKVYALIRGKNLASNILFSTFSRELLLIMKDMKQPHEEFRFGLLYKGTYAPWRLGLIAWWKNLTCFDNCWWANWREVRGWMIKHEIDAFIPNWPQIDNFLFRSGFKKHFVG